MENRGSGFGNGGIEGERAVAEVSRTVDVADNPWAAEAKGSNTWKEAVIFVSKPEFRMTWPP